MGKKIDDEGDKPFKEPDGQDAAPEGKTLICRPWITRNGQRVYASQYGKQAFCFYVDA